MTKEEKSRRFGLFFKLCITALVLFVILLILCLSAGWRNRRTVNKMLAELKAQGFRVSPEGLIPECPDEENAFLLYQQAEAMYVSPGLPSGVWRRVDEDWSSVSADEKVLLRGAITDNEMAIDICRKAAELPYCTVAVDYSKPMISWRRPRLRPKTSAIMRLLIVPDAKLAMDEGDWERAIEHCFLVTRSARVYLDYPFPSFESLVLYRISLHLCHDVLSGTPIAEESGRALIELLDPECVMDRFARSLEFDRLQCLDTLVRIVDGEDILTTIREKYFRFGQCRLDGVLGMLPKRFRTALYLKTMYFEDCVLLHDFLLRQIEALKLPYWKSKSLYEVVDKEVDALSDNHVFVKMFVPSNHSVLRGHVRTTAYMQATRLSIASKLHFQKSGEYPVSLDELSPEYFEEIPLDPFTGKPFIYRQLDDGGFVIYSVGKNETDDSARYTTQEEFQRVLKADPKTSDDIIWLERLVREGQK